MIQLTSPGEVVKEFKTDQGFIMQLMIVIIHILLH